MFKKFLKLIKKNEVNEEIEEVQNGLIKEEDRQEEEIVLEENNKENIVEPVEKIIEENKDSQNNIDIDMDVEYIKEGKIKREKSIKAIDLYTQEEQIFKTHRECSRKLRLPLGYIKENLKYGYTDYLGDAINCLNKELQTAEAENDTLAYLNNSKNPMELFNILNNRIFTAKISDNKRDNILSNSKIEPIKMHYVFECIDEEYDDYFKKYRSIIKRGGKKKIELVNKKGEAIEIFKSIDECATYLEKEKYEVVEMLKYGETKVGRYEIRYSLRNI